MMAENFVAIPRFIG